MDQCMTRLVIVESPTKAKTIKKFLPNDYVVEASMGHIRDLPSDASEIPAKYSGKEWARLGVNVEEHFAPLYVISKGKKKVVDGLKAALKDAQELILATDEDREGESIGWHLKEVLNPKVPVRRMVFHEITREAILDALKNPRAINEELVKAQEARRILDRLVGYTLSPLLWKKIAPGLSAGRVQSVAVRLIVTREEERRAFHSGRYWDLKATLSLVDDLKRRFEATLQSVGGVKVATSKDFDEATGKIAKGKKVLLLDQAQAVALRDRLFTAAWSVSEISERQQTRRPAPPFTTSTLQQEANRKLRLTSRKTMDIAQKLYENGYITYMRTDSVNLSTEAITAARREVEARYGKNYLNPTPRRYTTTSKSAQEAHEAIRPAGTQMRTADEIGLVGQEASLYDMIWKRTIATQMADAQITIITAQIKADDAMFQATGKRIDFPGYFRAYVEGSDDPDAAIDDQEVLLPPMKTGDPLKCHKLDPVEHETQPPNRFTEASLIQTLEREGVGRPSTYATIIGTIQDRGYVSKVNNQLVPTFTAMAVNQLLEKHFPDLVDVQFTARMEQTLDDIADGAADSLKYLQNFYQGEHGLETQVEEKAQSIDPRDIHALDLDDLNARVRIGKFGPYLEQQKTEADEALRVSLPPDLAPAELGNEAALKLLQQKNEGPAPLGRDPKTGKPVFVLNGRYGPYVQLGENVEGETPRRASLLRGMKPETITLETALNLLQLPRDLGVHPADGQQIVANVGKYGPYIKHGNDFRSLEAIDNVLTVTLARALELLAQPKARSARTPAAPLRELGAHPADGQPVVLMSGRYGPYAKHGEINATLPRGANLDKFTLDEAIKLIAAKASQPPSDKKSARRKVGAKKSSAKATAATKTTKTTGKASAKKPSTSKKPAAKKPATPAKPIPTAKKKAG
jgi:DNA topoisomerase-1